jgi:hypothetical protein
MRGATSVNCRGGTPWPPAGLELGVATECHPYDGHFLIASVKTRPVAFVGAVIRSSDDNVGAMSAGVAGSK